MKSFADVPTGGFREKDDPCSENEGPDVANCHGDAVGTSVCGWVRVRGLFLG